MNKARRNELNYAIKQLYEAFNTIESVREEEEEAYDNLPESIQNCERGEVMQENIDNLEDVTSQIEDIISILDDIIG